jgi:hypothetical protein
MATQTSEFGPLNSKWAILSPNSYIQTDNKQKQKVVFANETLALSKAVDLSDDLGVVQMIMILGMCDV